MAAHDNLHPVQFTERTYRTSGGFHNSEGFDGGTSMGGVKRESWEGPTDITSYDLHRASGPVSESAGDMADHHGSIEVVHKGGSGYTRYHGDDEVDYPGQHPLFSHKSSKGESYVLSMGGTKDVRMSQMTGLGIAANDTARTHGRELGASNNLSPHSHRIVEHLSGKGAVDAPPDNPTNSIDFWSHPTEWSPVDGESVSPERVAQGRRTVRGILGKRPRQFEQDQLPGMENF